MHEDRWTSTVLLFRLERRWLDWVLTVATVGLLVWSRFGLLANGPWEWDETLFARGIFHFNLAAHYPQPPGFPGWLAIGHLLLPLAGEPLKALQWGSAALSILALWPLASLGRRVAPPAVATTAALLVMVLPGPWLHAVRGFSSTPATTFALAAAALLAGGLAGRRATWFTLLVCIAFLVRPILLPGLGLLWLGGAWTVRPRRRLFPGVGLAAVLIVVTVAAMVAAQGGWGSFAAAFVAHAERHFSNLADNPVGPAGLGLITGVGGAFWALSLALLAGLGLVVWARRVGRGAVVLWLLVLGVTVGELAFLQNRAYTRYAVPVQLALAPLVAGGAAAAAVPAVAVGGLLALAMAAGVESYPLLAEQHTTELPGWTAVNAAFRQANVDGDSVVMEAGLYPFASYRWFLAGGGTLLDKPPLVLSPWAPAPWSGVAGRYLVATNHEEWYLGPVTGSQTDWGGVAPSLRPLTQGRFLEAALIEDPPLPVRGWWTPEETRSGQRFMWGTAGSELVLPPLPASTRLAVDLRPASGDAPLVLEVNGVVAREIGGHERRSRLWLGPGLFRADGPNRLTFRRSEVYPPGGRDERPLAVKLFAVWAVGPGVAWGGAVGSGHERSRLLVAVDGAYGPETIPGLGRGCWLRPHAELRVPAGAGTLVLALAAPRPQPARITISVGNRAVVGPLHVGGATLSVLVPISAGDWPPDGVPIRIDGDDYNPAREGTGTDRRDLGVFLLSVHFRPSPAGK